MTDAMRNRVFGVAAVVVAAAALVWISVSDLGENLVYYWTPSELVSAENRYDATVRLGGMVVPGSMEHDTERAHLSFDVTDGEETVHVESEGNPPQMFREGIGVVVEGKLAADGVFRSDKVMVKHSNEYEAPDEGHPVDVEELNTTLADGEGS